MRKNFAVGTAIILSVLSTVVSSVSIQKMLQNSRTETFSQVGGPFGDLDFQFNDFIAAHGRHYKSLDEYAGRRALFARSLALITSQNKKHSGWKGVLNKFADMTKEEKDSYLGVNKDLDDVAADMIVSPDTIIPGTQTDYISSEGYDWRSYMGPVGDQGKCGSCWSFTATGTIEGRWAVANGGKKISLSQQHLVDCDKKNSACKGGSVPLAMLFIEQSGGLYLSSDYPYIVKKGACKKLTAEKAVKISTIIFSIPDAKVALATGPVPLYVAVTDQFYAYGGGIYDSVGTAFNHGVVLVGWGKSLDGVEYWIVRNSWGPDWGEGGHMRIKINGNSKVMPVAYPETVY